MPLGVMRLSMLECKINERLGKANPQDREALFNQTATVKGISPEIIEKDFWVCWTLHQIFQIKDFPRLIFKGGTSLSKAFGIIKRFSEDVDLIVNRHELGFKDGKSVRIKREAIYETGLSLS